MSPSLTKTKFQLLIKVANEEQFDRWMNFHDSEAFYVWDCAQQLKPQELKDKIIVLKGFEWAWGQERGGQGLEFYYRQAESNGHLILVTWALSAFQCEEWLRAASASTTQAYYLDLSLEIKRKTYLGLPKWGRYSVMSIVQERLRRGHRFIAFYLSASEILWFKRFCRAENVQFHHNKKSQSGFLAIDHYAQHFLWQQEWKNWNCLIGEEKREELDLGSYFQGVRSFNGDCYQILNAQSDFRWVQWSGDYLRSLPYFWNLC